MIPKNTLKLLNKQIDMEGQASRNYLAMAVWCDCEGLDESATFFYRQAEEEREHMMKLVNYVLDSDCKAVLTEVKKPKSSFKDVVDVYTAAYNSEKSVSKSINAIVDSSLKEKDHQTHSFLQWFVEEQLEEEALFRKILDKISIIGKTGSWKYHIEEAINKINAQVVKEAAAEK